MAAKILRFHHDARERVRMGLNILASAVKVTLGTGALISFVFTASRRS